MKENKTFEFTERELKQIIDYIREEARLSYQLQKMLWLTKENLKLKKATLSLAERFRQRKSILRANISKEIYRYITDEDEVDTKFSYTKLKKNEKEE